VEIFVIKFEKKTLSGGIEINAGYVNDLWFFNYSHETTENQVIYEQASSNHYYKDVSFVNFTLRPAILFDTTISLWIVIEDSFFFRCTSYIYAGACYASFQGGGFVFNRVCAYWCYMTKANGEGQFAIIKPNSNMSCLFQHFSMSQCSPIANGFDGRNNIKVHNAVLNEKMSNLSRNKGNHNTLGYFINLQPGSSFKYCIMANNQGSESNMMYFQYQMMDFTIISYLYYIYNLFQNQGVHFYTYSRFLLENSVFSQNTHSLFFHTATTYYFIANKCLILHPSSSIDGNYPISKTSCNISIGDYESILPSYYYYSYLCLSEIQMFPEPTPPQSIPASPTECLYESPFLMKNMMILPITVSLLSFVISK